MRTLKKSWINWNKQQINNRTQAIEETINKVVPPWVNNNKIGYDNQNAKMDKNKLNSELTFDEMNRAI